MIDLAVQFPNIYRLDISKGQPIIKQLPHMGQNDKYANRIGVELYDGNTPVTPGGSCFGEAVLCNINATVPIENGVVVGNKVYVDLIPACYSVPGPIRVTVKWTDGTNETTVFQGFGNVSLTETGTVIDPGTIIPSVTALIAAIDAAVESIPQDYSVLSANMNALTHFDLSISGKYIASTGVETANSDYSCTDYIPVNSDSVLILDGFWTGTGAYAYMFYDSSKAKISGANSITSRTVVTTIPSTAAYVRFSSRTSQGETPVAYVSNHVVADVADLMLRMAAAEADATDLKSQTEQMETILLGDTTTPTPETENLNLEENGTTYASSSSYRTSYIPIHKNQKCVFTIVAAKSAEIRFGLAPQEPKAVYKATYLGKINLTANSTGTYEYTPTEDGFVSASYYYDALSSLTIMLYDGGIAKDVSEVPGLESLVRGEADSLTQTKVSGLNFAENATKYTASGNYETWYVPVIVGNEYVFAFDNSSNNANEVRFALSDEIPAADVAGTYLSKLNIVARSVAEKTLTASKNGYLGVAWYTGSGRDLVSVKEISGGLVQRVNVSEAKSAEIGGLADAIEDINDELTAMKGQDVQLESGSYWGATTVGTSVESQIQTSTSSTTKRTTLTLPANKVLRIMGVGVSDLTRLYWVFSASTGILIDIVDATDQLAPRGYYLRYNEDTHIYINCANAYDHFIGIVDDISPWVDISRCIGQTTRKIIDFGERDIRYAVRNMKRKSRDGSSYAPALFLHFSDIHGDAENLTRLMEFASDKHISNYLSDILCTGDVVKSTIADGMTWFDAISGTNKILLLPGNHDSVKGTASSPTTASKQEMYETLFEGRVSNWNVTQPSDAATEYKGYYYKDYAAAKLRLICLDANGSGDYQTTEVAWFADALEGARGLGYSVVCAEHFMFDRSVCTGVKCTFQTDQTPGDEGSWVVPNAYINAVETFIDNGGDFVCWLGGHVHKDTLLLHNNTHQLCIGVTTASHETHQISYEDSERIAGDKSQDAFNIIGFDTFAKRITILKIGSDLTRVLAHKRYLCIDYANRTVLFND